MWKIAELEYACLCVLESSDINDRDNAIESIYGYSNSSAKKLINEAEYVLNTFYEDGHVRNDWREEDIMFGKKECSKEMQAIRRWLKKWNFLIGR